MPSKISINYNHAFGDGQRQFSGEVDEQGRFKIIFPLEYPQEVMVIIGRAIFKLFSTPGAKQAMVVDESSFNAGISSWTDLKNIDFMGDLAVENEERRSLEPEFMKVRDYFVTDSMQKNLEPEAFMAYRLDLMKKHEAFYERYFDSIPVSSLVQDISRRSVRIYAADDLRRYIWLHSKIVDGGLSPVDVSEDYIRGVKKLLTNDLEDLITSEFANLMREFTMPILPSEIKVISDQMNQLTYELFKKLDLTETQLSGVEAWNDQIKKGVPRDSLVTSEEFKELSKSHQSTIFKFFKEAQWPHLLAKIADLGSIPRSSIIATFLDINYQATGEEIPEYIQNQLATLNLEPEILAVIEEEIADFERTKNGLFVEGVAISENTESVLAQLKEKHPGKVIYIDV